MKNKDERAFPVLTDTSKPGMALRDYFSAHALQGMLSNGYMPNQAAVDLQSKDAFTRAAYNLADAMLLSRE